MTSRNEKFNAMADDLFGGRHGWTVEAADMLGVSRKTISRAINGGPISDAVFERIEKEWLRTKETGIGVLSDYELDEWLVSAARTRSRDPLILDEIIVHHTREPEFRMRALIVQGPVNPRAILTVRWLDKIPDDARRLELETEAAEQVVHASCVRRTEEQERQTRLERMIDARKQRTLDAYELTEMTNVELRPYAEAKTTIYQIEEAIAKDLSAAASENIKRKEDLAAYLKDAGLSRELCGSIMSHAVGMAIASKHEGQVWMMARYVEKAAQDEQISPEPTYMSVRAYALLPYAHHVNALRAGSDVGVADDSPQRKAMMQELAAREAEAAKFRIDVVKAYESQGDAEYEAMMRSMDDLPDFAVEYIKANVRSQKTENQIYGDGDKTSREIDADDGYLREILEDQ